MSKADDCKAIFTRLELEFTVNAVVDYKALRSAAIAAFISEAGCTTAGAATYYANCKNRGGATGSYIQKGVGHARTTVTSAPESNVDDDRALYSAVQLNRENKVAAVACFMNPVDALVRAKLVHGICVLGAPEAGLPVDPSTVFDDTILNTKQ